MVTTFSEKSASTFDHTFRGKCCFAAPLFLGSLHRQWRFILGSSNTTQKFVHRLPLAANLTQSLIGHLATKI